jgi:hypothetical protein
MGAPGAMELCERGECTSVGNVRAWGMYEQNPDVLPAFLMGGMSSLRFDPSPAWSMTATDGRHLHGALSDLCGATHIDHAPYWSLWREGSRWWVYWYTDMGCRLAGGSYQQRVFSREHTLTIGPYLRGAILLPDGDRFRCTLQSQSLIVNTRGGDRRQRHRIFAPPSDDQSVWSHLMGIQTRLRTQYHLPRANVRLRRVIVREDEIFVGGKISRGTGRAGRVRGWTGSLTIETDRVGAWIMRAAEHVGYGGMTAMGLGRVRVDVSPC